MPTSVAGLGFATIVGDALVVVDAGVVETGVGNGAGTATETTGVGAAATFAGDALVVIDTGFVETGVGNGAGTATAATGVGAAAATAAVSGADDTDVSGIGAGTGAGDGVGAGGRVIP